MLYFNSRHVMLELRVELECLILVTIVTLTSGDSVARWFSRQ